MCKKSPNASRSSKTVYWVCRQWCNVEFQLRLNVTAKSENKEIKAVSIALNVTQRLLKRRSSRTPWKTRISQQKPNAAHVMRVWKRRTGCRKPEVLTRTKNLNLTRSSQISSEVNELYSVFDQSMEKHLAKLPTNQLSFF